MDDFPPKVPCPPNECAYGHECGPESAGYGCGGCCACLGACHLEYDLERAYIPETREEARLRKHWEAARKVMERKTSEPF